MDIKEHQVFESHNLIACEGTYYNHEIDSVISRMKREIKEQNAKKVGPIISTTLAAYKGEEAKFDILIMIPIDKPITIKDEEFEFRPAFKIENAVTIRHTGTLEELLNTGNYLLGYIQANNLQPCTTGYNVAIKEADDRFDTMVVDIYIGIKEK